MTHLELLVEEPSMEAFLRALMPRIIPVGCTFQAHSFQGKTDLMSKLPDRLYGYASWLPPEWRIIIVVDLDDDNCLKLKQHLEQIANDAGLRTRSTAAGQQWQVANRIAIEELEAWYFGDWQAVCAAYPRVPQTIPARAKYRNTDKIQGGTWEALERILKRSRYFKTGLRKTEAARSVGAWVSPARSRSPSFRVFYSAVTEACQ